ncbi:MAG: hypothetical protein BGP22_17795 [Variovorax sp. 67-131]|nr:MAG: hypothetical protein BGP22_17795 [Variovorax sp. 67-131]
MLQNRDEFIQGRGPDILSLRTYNSQGLLDDPNANRWNVGAFGQKVTLMGTVASVDSSLMRTDRDGAQAVYTWDGASSRYASTAGAGAFDTIAYDESAAQFVWTDGDTGLTERYQSTGPGRLLRATDADGNTVSYAYNVSGTVQSLTDANGEVTYYDYSGNQLTQIRSVDVGGKGLTRVRYGYDGGGRLSTVTADLSPEDGNIADGRTYVTAYTYDGASSRVASVAQSDGTTLAFTYVHHEGAYKVASVTDSLGAVTRFSYDTAQGATTVTDPLGAQSVYSYDAQGQLLELRQGVTASHPRGASQVSYSYDAFGNVKDASDGEGYRVDFIYDQRGNLSAEYDSDRGYRSREYGEQNQLLSETTHVEGPPGTSGSSSETVRYMYAQDNPRRLRFVIGAQGNVTEYRYDAYGQRVVAIEYREGTYDYYAVLEASRRIPDEAQMVAWQQAQDLTKTRRTDYVHDGRGALSSSTVYAEVGADGQGIAASAAMTRYIYDARGLLLQKIEPGDAASTTTYTYDGLGRVLSASGPSLDGGVTPNTTITSYDDAGGKATISIASGLVTTSTYDRAGRLVSVTQQSAGAGVLGTTSYAYDKSGNLLMTQDPTGARKWMLYDEANRKIADIDGTGAVIEYAYNSNGTLRQTIAYGQRIDTAVLVDGVGLPTTAWSPTNTTTSLAALRPASRPEDQKVWNFYDGANRLAFQVDGSGYVTQTVYDSASRVLSTTKLANPVDVRLLEAKNGPRELGNVAVTLRADAGPVPVRTAVTMTASVADVSSNGMVTFFSGDIALGSAPVIGGIATFVSDELPSGVNSIRASYTNGAQKLASVSSVAQVTVTPARTSAQLALSSSRIASGDAVVLSMALIHERPLGLPGATGEVRFYGNDALIGTASVIDGLAMLKAPIFPVGSVSVRAVYAGDSTHETVSAETKITVEKAATRTTLQVSRQDALLRLKATVMGSGESALLPQGAVVFYDGDTLIGRAALRDGIATLDVASPVGGKASYRVEYTGDAHHVQSARHADPFVTLEASAKSTVQGGPITLNMEVIGKSAGGRAGFFADSLYLGTAEVVDGRATLVTNYLPVGSHVLLSASLQNDGNGADAAVVQGPAVEVVVGSQEVRPPSVQSLLIDQIGRAVVGELIGIKLTVPRVPDPSASDFLIFDGKTLIGRGQAGYGDWVMLPSLSFGTHDLTLVYDGELAQGRVSTATVQVVVERAQVRIDLASSTQPQAAVRGSPVTFSARVRAAGDSRPTGEVTFYRDGVAMGTADVVDGMAKLERNEPILGIHSITASYSGDDSHEPSGNTVASAQSALIQKVVASANAKQTRTDLSILPATIIAKQSFSLAVYIREGDTQAPVVRGTVRFYEGTRLLGIGTVDYGSAYLPVAGLAAGVHQLRAVLIGDDTYAASETSLKVSVPKISSYVYLDTEATSLMQGQPVTLTAQVRGGVVPASGRMNFFADTQFVGSAAVVDGLASLTTSNLPVGSNIILSASYGGDDVYLTGLGIQKLWEPGKATIRTIQVLPGGQSLEPATTRTMSFVSPNYSGAAGQPLDVDLNIGSNNGFKNGNFAVFQGQTLIGSYALDPASPGRIRIEGLQPGHSELTVVYTDGTNAPAAVATTQAYIGKARPDLAELTSSRQMSVEGQPLTFFVKIRNSDGSEVYDPPMTGTVTIFGSSGTLGTTALRGGWGGAYATLTVSDLPAGSYSFGVRYSGDANYEAHTYTPWNEEFRQQIAMAPAASSMRMEHWTYGSSLNVQVHLQGQGVPDSGTVSFYDGNTLLNRSNVYDGRSHLSAGGLKVGDHVIRAVYSGDANNAGSESSTVVSIAPVGAAHTTLANRSEASISQDGALNVDLYGARAGSLVSFYQGADSLGTALTINGRATLIGARLPPGNQRITAVYAGDADTAGSILTFMQSVKGAAGGAAPQLKYDAAQDRTVSRLYGHDGRLQGLLDGEGYLTEYKYNAAGEIVETIRRAERSVTEVDRATAVADARASRSLAGLRRGDSADDIHTYNFYDARGRLVGQVDGEGYLNETVYDARGNITQTIRYANKAGAIGGSSTLQSIRPVADNARDHRTVQAWSAANQLLSRTNAEGTVTRFTYDSIGQLVQTTTAVGTADERTSRRRYDIQGRLAGELDGRGSDAVELSDPLSLWAANGLTHTYDAAGRRASTTDANGRRTLFFYDAVGRLAYTVNDLGEVAESRYSAHGQLSEQVVYGTPVDVVTLATATPGGLNTDTLIRLLEGVADDVKDTRVLTRYNATGTKASSTSAVGDITDYSYNAFREATSSSFTLKDGYRVTDTASFDRRGLLVESTKDRGLVVEGKTYDAFGRETGRIDGKKNPSLLTYDRLGRTVTVTDALRSERVTTYDAFDRVLTQRDTLGHVTLYSYDQANRGMTVTTPEGVRMTTLRNRQGQIHSVSDGRGNTTTHSYDKSGNLLRTEAPEGIATASTYDKAGFALSSTDANGVVTDYAYDAANRLLTRTVDAAGLRLVTAYGYDAKGQKISVKDPRGVVTTTEFNRGGQAVRQVVDPEGLALATSYEYDTTGKVLKVTDPNGVVKQYSYDGAGRRVKEVLDPNDPLVPLDYKTGPLNLVRSYTYDGNGNVVKALDANGNATNYAYDANNRMAYTLDALGNVSRNVYDSEGRVARTIRYAAPVERDKLPDLPDAIDIASRVVADPATDMVEERRYDRDGRLHFTVDGTGAVIEYKYDTSNNVVETRSYARRIDLATWEPNSDPAVVADDGDSRVRTVYDGFNRAVWKVDGAGGVSSNSYDDNGNITEVRTYANALTRASFEAWDGRSAPAVMADDTRDQRVRTVFDAANRAVSQVDGVGGVVRTAYDSNGNTLERRAYANRLEASALAAWDGKNLLLPKEDGKSDQHVRNIYDAAGRLTWSVDGEGAVTSNEYDANGNVTYRTRFAEVIGRDASPDSVKEDFRDQVTRYIYDAANRVSYRSKWQGRSATGGGYGSPFGSREEISYDYDGVGRLLRQTVHAALPQVAPTGRVDEADRTSYFVYDAAGRLAYSVDAEGGVTRNSYDGAGRLVRTLQAANSIWNLPYFAAFPEARRDLPLDRTLTSAPYFRRGRGDFLRLSAAMLEAKLTTDASADRITVMAYDGAGRRTLTIDAMGGVTNNAYDAFGNLTQQVGYAIRIAPPEWSPGINRTAFDPAGLKKSEADRISYFAYDQAQRRVLTVDALGAVTETAHDGIGQAIKTRSYARAIDATGLSNVAAPSALRSRITSDATADRVSRQVFDASGRVIYGVDALGYVSKTHYDGVGRVRGTTQYARPILQGTEGPAVAAAIAISPDDRSKSFEVDTLGRVVLSVDAMNGTESWTYDSRGNKTSYTNAKNAVWTYEYDGMGRMTAEISPQVDLTRVRKGSKDRLEVDEYRSGTNQVVTSMEYDALGNMTSRTEAWGRPEARRTRYAYDGLGRQIWVEFQEKRPIEPMSSQMGYEGGDLRTLTTYDAFGNAIANVDVSGHRSYKTYDSLGRVVHEIDALGYVTGYQRNVFGEVTALTRHAQGIDLDAGHWPEGSEPSAKMVAAVLRPGDADRIIVTSRDRLGRAIEVKEPSVSFHDSSAAFGARYGFDGKSIRNTYDGFGNLVQVARRLNSDSWVLAATNYHDLRGQQVATVDALGYLTTQVFDAAGNVVDRVEYAKALPGWIGTSNLAAWTGLADARTDRTPPAPTVDMSSDRRTATTYDRNNRKTSETRVHVEHSTAANGTSERGNLTTSYGYDAVGNLTRTTDAAGASTYSYYDALERVTAVAEPTRAGSDGATFVTPLTVFRRDAHGNVVTKTEYINGAGVEDQPANPRPMPALLVGPNPEVARAQASGWQLNGNIGYMSATPFDGGEAVYRVRTDFFGPLHYYTQSVEKRDELVASGLWHDEGIIGYIASQQQEKTVPLYKVQLRLPPFWPRELQPFSAYYLLTTSKDEVDDLVQKSGATPQGIVGYVGDARDSQFDTGLVRMFNPLVGDHFFLPDTVQMDPYEDAELVSSTDRTSYAQYDLLGRVVQSTDAMGVNHYNNYNDRGQLTEEWQYVRGGDKTQQRLFRRHEYDALGRQVRVIEPGTASDNATYTEGRARADGVYAANPKVTLMLGVPESVNPNAPGQESANGKVVVQMANIVKANGGAVKVEFDFVTPETAAPDDGSVPPKMNPGEPATFSQVFDQASGAGLSHGVKLTPTDPIGTVSTIRILQQDAAGKWVLLWQGTPTEANGEAYLNITGAERQVETVMDYNAFGEMVSKRVNGQAGEYFDYDRAGRLWRTNAGDGVDKIAQYDLLGRQTSEVRSAGSGRGNLDLGSLSSAAQANQLSDLRRTDTAYDLLGRVTSQALAERAPQDSPWALQRPVINQNVDRWGNVVSISDPRSTGWITHYRYNANNQLTTQIQTDRDGNSGVDAYGNIVNSNAAVTRIYYDAMGRQVAVRDANERINGQEWDAGGNLVRELHADGNGVSTGVVSHAYDAFGNKVRTIDAEGKRKRFLSDKFNRSLKTVHEAVAVYQGASLEVVPQGSREVVETNTWDAAGRKTSQTNGNGDTIRYAYDPRGNLIRTTLAEGEVTRAAYDARNRKIIEMDGNGALATWKYDYFGRLQGRSDIGGATYSYSYDNARQLTRQTSTNSSNVVTFPGTSNPTQDLSYQYDGAGQLLQVHDASLGKTSRYSYDLAGRRVRETTEQAGVSYQDNSIAYDALGRMRWVSDSGGRATVEIEHDKVGNRTRIHTRVNDPATGVGADNDRYFAYDAMNRQTLVDSASADGSALGPDGHRLAYDYNGNRTKDTSTGTHLALVDGQWSSVEGETTEEYTYDRMNRLSTVTRDGVKVDERLYDGASRVVASGVVTSTTHSVGLAFDYAVAHMAANGAPYYALAGGAIDGRINTYNKNGQLLGQNRYEYGIKRDSTIYDNGAHNLDALGFEKGSVIGYDKAGNLLGYFSGYLVPGSTSFTHAINNVGRADGYRTDSTWVRNGTVGTANSANAEGRGFHTFDANGQTAATGDSNFQLLGKDNRIFVNDANGTTLYTRYMGGQAQRQLVVNGEVLGRYGLSVNEQVLVSPPNLPRVFAPQASFGFGYRPIDEGHPAATPGSYAVREGDTLQGIAKSVYGDSSLWYLLAEANGVASGSELQRGQVLIVPTHVSSANNASTFKPYDPSKIIGDTSPALMAMPGGGGKEGCGGFGQVIVAVVAVVVAAVTQQWYLTSVLNVSGGIAGAISSGAYGSLAVSGAIGGIAGSVASQGVGIAIGAQESFSWKGVALGALGGAISAGLGATGLGSAVAKATTPLVGRIVTQALSNAATQGIAVVTGLQDKFNWRSVAASAASAGVSQALNAAMDYNPLNGFEIEKSLASGLGGSLVVQAVRGGKISAAALASDAFGNVLGDAITTANGLRSKALDDQAAADARSGRTQNLAQLRAWAGGYSGDGVGVGDRGTDTAPVRPFLMNGETVNSSTASMFPTPQIVSSGPSYVLYDNTAETRGIAPQGVGNVIGNVDVSGTGTITPYQGIGANLIETFSTGLSLSEKWKMASGQIKYAYRGSNLAQGAVQILGGGLEVWGATTLSATGVGAIVGVPMALHGGDNIGTGLNRMLGLGDGTTLTYQGTYALTGSSTAASFVDQGISFAGGVASLASSMRSAWTITAADKAAGLRYEAAQALALLDNAGSSIFISGAASVGRLPAAWGKTPHATEFLYTSNRTVPLSIESALNQADEFGALRGSLVDYKIRPNGSVTVDHGGGLFINYRAVSDEAFDAFHGSNRLAAYRTPQEFLQNKLISWSDAFEGGVVNVHIRQSTLLSDRASVAALGHEYGELQTVFGRVGNGSYTIGKWDSFINGAHEQVVPKVDRIIGNMIIGGGR